MQAVDPQRNQNTNDRFNGASHGIDNGRLPMVGKANTQENDAGQCCCAGFSEQDCHIHHRDNGKGDDHITEKAIMPWNFPYQINDRYCKNRPYQCTNCTVKGRLTAVFHLRLHTDDGCDRRKNGHPFFSPQEIDHKADTDCHCCFDHTHTDSG